MRIEVASRQGTLAFDAAPGQVLLRAGLMQGVALPHACASGTCGTCRARRVEGDLVDLWPQAPGRRALRHADDFLLCQCAARSALRIEVPGAVDAAADPAPRPRPMATRIVHARRLNADVMDLTVAVDAPLHFEAGQFVLAEVPGIEGGRGWSMADHDPPAGRLRFVLKRQPGGRLSDWLFDAPRDGAALTLFGPLGRATFDPSLQRDLLCIAGGSGLAGMLSILACAGRAGWLARHDADLFFGVRRPEDLFLADELTTLRHRFGERLRITVALSDAAPDDTLRAAYPALNFAAGPVHEVAGRALHHRLPGVRAHLAGPAPAVDAALRMLLRTRVPATEIRYDKFT